jgi:hypothetical protein
MDEGKIYKIDITSLMLPTPPESIVVEQIGPSSNKVKWWKANVDTHKIFGYIIYRQPASASMPPTPVDSIGWVAHRFGAGVVDSFVDNDASKSPGDYKYSVEAVNYYGYGGWGASAWAGATGVETPLAIDVPTVYALRLRGPNPSGKNGVTIECQLPRPGQTSINIYNLLGERIRTLCQGYLPASSHRWQWDGRDDRGRAVATGIYICRLVSGDYSASVRIDLLK